MRGKEKGGVRLGEARGAQAWAVKPCGFQGGTWLRLKTDGESGKCPDMKGEVSSERQHQPTEAPASENQPESAPVQAATERPREQS